MPPPAGQPVGAEHCYRHPQVITGVHCTRCERPICPDCMVVAPVGYQCPECVGDAKRDFKRTGAGPQQLRSQSGTPVTIALLGLIAAGYVLQVASGGGVNANGTGTAYLWGVSQPLAIAGGEYWRLITAVFLHSSIIHLAANAWGLYIFGSFVERTLGRALLLGLFLTTGIAASATSYALSANILVCQRSLGASGAVFGLFGAFLAYNYRRRHTQLGRAMLQQMMPWLILNIFISLAPGIDWRAHLGGLVAGFLAGYVLESLTEKTSRRNAVVAVLGGLVVISIVLVAWKTQQLQPLINPVVEAACSRTP